MAGAGFRGWTLIGLRLGGNCLVLLCLSGLGLALMLGWLVLGLLG